MLVNLAYLLSQPTGTTHYALNLLPFLSELDPCFLATAASGLDNYCAVPHNMTAEYGMKGHLRRLLWTQFQLPQIYRHQISSRSHPFLFSPITEAPLFSDCRFVVTVHDLIPLRFPMMSKSLTWLYRHYVPQVVNAAEHVICNSQATADDLMAFYGLSSRKITPILLAHDGEHFRPLRLKRQNFFLILGRQAPYKNVAIALYAFSQLSNYRDYELWIAGPPDRRYTPELQQQATDLHIAEHVKFLDYVPYTQLPSLINQALALVFPSLWEGFGLPVLEAMACGTPVIATNLASIPEVTGNAALLIDPASADSLADSMAAVARDRTLQNQLSAAGLQRASQFSWQTTGKATAALLKGYC